MCIRDSFHALLHSWCISSIKCGPPCLIISPVIPSFPGPCPLELPLKRLWNADDELSGRSCRVASCLVYSCYSTLRQVPRRNSVWGRWEPCNAWHCVRGRLAYHVTSLEAYSSHYTHHTSTDGFISIFNSITRNASKCDQSNKYRGRGALSADPENTLKYSTKHEVDRTTARRQSTVWDFQRCRQLVADQLDLEPANVIGLLIY